MNTAAEMTATKGGPRVLYTARVHTTGGRDGGNSKSDDGHLEVRHTVPGKGTGTNPEQLFAAGWSACFEGALLFVAQKAKVRLPPEMAIDAEVDLRMGDDGFSLEARMNVSLPGVPRDVAQKLIADAENTCPYSKAVKGNIQSTFNLV
jgi:Ohr subfamily peroxiredoxin